MGSYLKLLELLDTAVYITVQVADIGCKVKFSGNDSIKYWTPVFVALFYIFGPVLEHGVE